jgi:DNA-binding MarR family transcriptional regulator
MTLQREQTHSSRQPRVVRGGYDVKTSRTKAARAKAPRTTSRTTPVRAQTSREHEGYLIKELQHLLRTRIETRIRTKGLWLSFPHSMVLMTLSEQPGLSGAQLARCLGVTAQTMNGLLVPLEQKGLITREHDPDNARVLKSVLTSKGRQLLQQGMQEAGAVFAQMIGTLSERERSNFRHLLRRCIDALSRPVDDSAAEVMAPTPRRRVRTRQAA